MPTWLKPCHHNYKQLEKKVYTRFGLSVCCFGRFFFFWCIKSHISWVCMRKNALLCINFLPPSNFLLLLPENRRFALICSSMFQFLLLWEYFVLSNSIGFTVSLLCFHSIHFIIFAWSSMSVCVCVCSLPLLRRRNKIYNTLILLLHFIWIQRMKVLSLSLSLSLLLSSLYFLLHPFHCMYLSSSRNPFLFCAFRYCPHSTPCQCHF